MGIPSRKHDRRFWLAFASWPSSLDWVTFDSRTWDKILFFSHGTPQNQGYQITIKWLGIFDFGDLVHIYCKGTFIMLLKLFFLVSEFDIHPYSSSFWFLFYAKEKIVLKRVESIKSKKNAAYHNIFFFMLEMISPCYDFHLLDIAQLGTSVQFKFENKILAYNYESFTVRIC